MLSQRLQRVLVSVRSSQRPAAASQETMAMILPSEITFTGLRMLESLLVFLVHSSSDYSSMHMRVRLYTVAVRSDLLACDRLCVSGLFRYFGRMKQYR